MSIEKRLAKDPELENAYQATFQKDLEINFVRRLDQADSDNKKKDLQWFLPHHPLKDPHKPGKVRRVCNAASKFKGSALNDELLSGPASLRNLVGIVFRFIEIQKTITADFESMFLQMQFHTKNVEFYTLASVIRQKISWEHSSSTEACVCSKDVCQLGLLTRR